MSSLLKKPEQAPQTTKTHRALKWMLTFASGLFTSGLVALLNDRL